MATTETLADIRAAGQQDIIETRIDRARLLLVEYASATYEPDQAAAFVALPKSTQLRLVLADLQAFADRFGVNLAGELAVCRTNS